MIDESRMRPAVRALVMDEAGDLLLVRFSYPTYSIWAAPGGGIEPGEDHQTALLREVHEETGLSDVQIGPLAWVRDHEVPLRGGRWVGQREHFYMIRTQRFEPQPAVGWHALREESVHELRWWSIADIERSSETFTPNDIVERIRAL